MEAPRLLRATCARAQDFLDISGVQCQFLEDVSPTLSLILYTSSMSLLRAGREQTHPEENRARNSGNTQPREGDFSEPFPG